MVWLVRIGVGLLSDDGVQEFAHAGFPLPMIFMCNANGSLNAADTLDLKDLRQGTALLKKVLCR